ncbi:MAG: aspartyl protease family protein [Acidobacteriota bacterium]
MTACRTIRQGFSALAAFALAGGLFAQGRPQDEVRILLAKTQYAEALARADAALASSPADPELLMGKVDALLGLDRTLEARQLSLSNAALDAGLRYRAGICSMRFGRVQEALDLWKPVLADPQWGEAACRESVRGLLASGREEEARLLFLEGLSKAGSAGPALLNLGVGLDLGPEGNAALAQKSQAAAPEGSERIQAWLKLRAAAGGDLCRTSVQGSAPLKIALKEKTERVEANTLEWGGSGGASPLAPAAEGSVSTSSGQQGYGAGSKDTSSKEGGRAGTLSSHPRVVVDARLNGERSEPMVLDSGMDTVLLSSRVVKKLGLQPVAPGEYSGTGLEHPVSSKWFLLKEIQVGPVTFKDVPALMIDEKTEFWKETGGILPLWLFRGYGIHYDRRHGKLELLESGTPPDQVLGAGATRLNALWLDGKPYVETRIQNKPMRYLLLANNVIATYLEERRLDDLGVTLQTSKYGTQQSRGHFSIILSGIADNVALNLGSTRINLPTVHAADLCPDCGVECSGILGRNVLDLFDVYFDYRAGVVALKGYEKGR